MLVDQRTENVTVPLNVALESEGKLELANSTFYSLFDFWVTHSYPYRFLERIWCPWCEFSKSSCVDLILTVLEVRIWRQLGEA